MSKAERIAGTQRHITRQVQIARARWPYIALDLRRGDHEVPHGPRGQRHPLSQVMGHRLAKVSVRAKSNRCDCDHCTHPKLRAARFAPVSKQDMREAHDAMAMEGSGDI